MIAHYHKFQWFYLTFLTVVFVSLGAYYLVHLGYYPVAIINSQWITARELNDEYAVAYRYYTGAALLSGKGIDVESRDFKKEIRRTTLNDLVEKIFIRQELKKRVGKDLSGILESKINASADDAKNLEEAAKLLYGLDLADFREMVLVPIAEREILEGRLFLEKKDLNSWLLEEEKNAKVFIITPEFYWDSNKVVLRS